MDRVPAAFRNAVSATWTCCPYGVKCVCKGPTLRSRGWAFTRSSTRTAFEFHIGMLRGQWVYCFRDFSRNDDFLTLADMKNLPNAAEFQTDETELLPLDSDFEEMLEWVSWICNRPWMYFCGPTVPFFCAKGKILLEWIERKVFSIVYFGEFNFIHGHLERFVEQQKAALYPTMFVVNKIVSGAIILENWLKKGPIYTMCIKDTNHPCPPDVLKGYLKRFMEHPGDFKEVKFEILVPFAGDFKKMMREVKRRYGRFYVTKSDGVYYYHNENLHVQVEKKKEENGDSCHIVCSFESS